MKPFSLLTAVVVLSLTLAPTPVSASTVILDKTPDGGAFWHPLSFGGTRVYANSFVFTGATGTLLDTVGIYMRRDLGAAGLGDEFRFQVFADAGNAPDPFTVLGSSGVMQISHQVITLVTAPLLAPFALTNGVRYWIAGSTVGLSAGGGAYQVGAHTQNSIYPDNGTFWFSNDVAGLVFDGQALTPEMGIYAEAAAVPEPATLLLLGTGLAAAGVRRRMKKRS